MPACIFDGGLVGSTVVQPVPYDTWPAATKHFAVISPPASWSLIAQLSVDAAITEQSGALSVDEPLTSTSSPVVLKVRIQPGAAGKTRATALVSIVTLGRNSPASKVA